MGYELELKHLRKRVMELESQVEQLRISRRVLMNLIEKIEKEKECCLSQLEKENKRLQSNNKRYAKWLMSYNFRLVEITAERDSMVENNETR